MRRKWTVRVRAVTGQDGWIVITVPAGEGRIHVSASPPQTRWEFTPEDVSKLRRYCLEAQVQAISDLDHW
jgi:hypothetical protein